jgi:hypothetical protein
MMVYKLGDGPFNYDWNPRYVKIEGTELFYSPTQSDMKTINILGGAVSSICSIKEKPFSICITLPPPVNKNIFLAMDSIQDCIKLRDMVCRATHNEVHTENYHSDVDEHMYGTFETVKQSVNNLKDDMISVCLSKINKFNKFYSEEFLLRIERIKQEIVSVNTKYPSRLKGMIKIFSPSSFDYSQIYERVKSKE